MTAAVWGTVNVQALQQWFKYIDVIIMVSKMLTTSDGTYTNAVYGFLSILFKIEEDLNPDYIAVAFDLKGPTERHKMYEGYKANRHGMPDELAQQMPIIKDVLKAMNIKIIER